MGWPWCLPECGRATFSPSTSHAGMAVPTGAVPLSLLMLVLPVGAGVCGPRGTMLAVGWAAAGPVAPCLTQGLPRAFELRGGGGSSQEHTTYLDKLIEDESSSEIEGAFKTSPSRGIQLDAGSSMRSEPLGRTQVARAEGRAQAPRVPICEMQPAAAPSAAQRAGSVSRETPVPVASAAQTDGVAQGAEHVLSERRKLLARIQQNLQRPGLGTTAPRDGSTPTSLDEICYEAAGAGAMTGAGDGAQLQGSWQYTTNASTNASSVTDAGAGEGAADARAGAGPSTTTTESGLSSLAEEPSLEDYIAVPPGQMAMDSLRRWGWNGTEQDLHREASQLLRCIDGQPYFLGAACATASVPASRGSEA